MTKSRRFYIFFFLFNFHFWILSFLFHWNDYANIRLLGTLAQTRSGSRQVTHPSKVHTGSICLPYGKSLYFYGRLL